MPIQMFQVFHALRLEPSSTKIEVFFFFKSDLLSVGLCPLRTLHVNGILCMCLTLEEFEARGRQALSACCSPLRPTCPLPGTAVLFSSCLWVSFLA